MRSVNENISIAKKCGMKLINHFPLPHYAWKLEFYDHIEAKTKELQQKYPDNQEAQECFSMILDEIKIFDKYNTYFGYEFFVLRK